MNCPACHAAMNRGMIEIDAQSNPIMTQHLMFTPFGGAKEVLMYNHLKLSAYRCVNCSAVLVTDEECIERE